ncbi:hypothetical protein V6N12_031842 [Hibiscus sabdariffa]|uniref:Uncharacterized protein n=1 Tax=Hibiscus sabdariffa TaxID=183260 RepID=A0ABR2BYA9_9ROSI
MSMVYFVSQDLTISPVSWSIIVIMFEQIADLSMLDLDDFVSFIVLFERPSAVNVHNPILRPTLSFAVDLGASSGYRYVSIMGCVLLVILIAFYALDCKQLAKM